MSTKRVHTWSFRLVGTLGHEIWLEFDGVAGFREGLEGFLQG